VKNVDIQVEKLLEQDRKCYFDDIEVDEDTYEHYLMEARLENGI